MRNKRVMTIVLMTVLFVSVFALSVVAAYIGRGSKKGVIIASKYYFESDTLEDVADAAAVETMSSTPIMCPQGNNRSSVKRIRIQNYKNLTYNNFDVTYSLKIWLSGADDANYDYFYRINSEEENWTQVTTTAYNTASTVTSLSLGHTGIDSDYLDIKWDFTGEGTEDPNLANQFFVMAEPTSPDYILSKKIGAAFKLGTFSTVTGYSEEYGFYLPAWNYPEETNYTGDLKKYTAFQYRIKVNGTSTVGRVITLTWDASKLSLSPLDTHYGSVSTSKTTVEEVDIYTSKLSIPLTSDSIIVLTFVRSYGVDYGNWLSSDETPSTLGLLSASVSTTP